MNELRAAAREDTRLTIGDIVAKLEQCFNGAIEDRQWSAACQAAMSQAKALGLIVERKAIGIKPIDSMSEAELAILVGEGPGQRGKVTNGGPDRDRGRARAVVGTVVVVRLSGAMRLQNLDRFEVRRNGAFGRGHALTRDV